LKTIILVDSCCDLPRSYLDDNKDHIDVIGMPVIIGNKEYFDDLSLTFVHKGLYQALRQGVKASTSRINSFRFYDKFKKYVSQGYKVLYMGLSKNMSKTHQNALKARKSILKDYPEAQIYVMNSISASIGLGVLVMKVTDLKKEGADFTTLCHWIDKHQEAAQHWFMVNNFNFLKRGGRVTTSQAMMGNLLNVKPILTVNGQGVLETEVNLLGKKKALDYLVTKFKSLVDPSLFDHVILGHGDAIQDIHILRDMIQSEMPDLKLMITEFSATIASHVGPDMLAIGFLGHSRIGLTEG